MSAGRCQENAPASAVIALKAPCALRVSNNARFRSPGWKLKILSNAFALVKPSAKDGSSPWAKGRKAFWDNFPLTDNRRQGSMKQFAHPLWCIYMSPMPCQYGTDTTSPAKQMTR